MASKSSARASRDATSVNLLDALSGFLRAYKMRMRTILADVSSGESTPSRIMVVVVLRKNGSLPMGSIAAYVGLPKSNITALVDDLEAEGVLRRRRDETDRRVTHVELTAKGRALCAREYDAYERSLSAIFDTLTDAERRSMLSGLERMTTTMRAVEDGDESTSEPPAPRRRSDGHGRRAR